MTILSGKQGKNYLGWYMSFKKKFFLMLLHEKWECPHISYPKFGQFWNRKKQNFKKCLYNRLGRKLIYKVSHWICIENLNYNKMEVPRNKEWVLLYNGQRITTSGCRTVFCEIKDSSSPPGQLTALWLPSHWITSVSLYVLLAQKADKGVQHGCGCDEQINDEKKVINFSFIFDCLMKLWKWLWLPSLYFFPGK